MMLDLHVSMRIKATREDLLRKLRENRANHATIVAEARKGYIEKASVELSRRLDQLREGKIVSLDFRLVPPQDYTSAYDTIIQMLEWSTENEIELSASEFRMFVEDEWSWIDEFLSVSNSYSSSSRAYATSKGKL